MDSHPWAAAAISSDVAGPDELLTPGQAGDYLRTGERFIRRLIAEHRIPYVKLGKHVRLQRSALDAFIQSGRVPSALNVVPDAQSRTAVYRVAGRLAWLLRSRSASLPCSR